MGSASSTPEEVAAPLRLEAYVLDCPDPRALAEFYGRLLGWWVDEQRSDHDWVELVEPSSDQLAVSAGGPPLAFQRDPQFRPSTWPDRAVPQMAHLDVRVATLDEGHDRAIAACAYQLPQPADRRDAGFRVYLDPAGHPFCVCAHTG